jgi:hypothetical protein
MSGDIWDVERRRQSLILHHRVQFCTIVHNIRLWNELLKNVNALKHVNLTAVLSRPPATAEHTNTEQANSCYITHGHYSITWPHVYLEDWPHFSFKGKAIPLQALTGPEGSRRLRLPDFITIDTWRWQGCQPCALAAFTPRKHSWYLFLLEAALSHLVLCYMYIFNLIVLANITKSIFLWYALNGPE